MRRSFAQGEQQVTDRWDLSLQSTSAHKQRKEACDKILTAFEFTADELDEFSDLPPISCFSKKGTETKVPAAYVRAKARRSFQRAWLNTAEATHNLFITDLENNDELVYPMNEVSLNSPGRPSRSANYLDRAAEPVWELATDVMAGR